MKLNKHKTALIPFIDTKKKTIHYETKKVIGSNHTMTDNTGKEYQLFFQDDLQEVSGIRVNNPKMGMVINKTFMAISTYESLRDNFNHYAGIVSDHDLRKRSEEMICNYELIEKRG